MVVKDIFEIWHNPKCSKSRAALRLLQSAGHAPNVRLYTENPPSAADIRAVLQALGCAASKLIRRQDALFRDLKLTAEMDEDTLIAAMVDHPALIERPLVRKGPRAAIGRPPEAVLDIL